MAKEADEKFIYKKLLTIQKWPINWKDLRAIISPEWRKKEVSLTLERLQDKGFIELRAIDLEVAIIII